MKIPFLDLDAQYRSIKDDIDQSIARVIETKNFIQGKFVDEFCLNFTKVHGGEHAVGCANGTSAITVLLRALGVGPGDEVITVTNTFFATLEAIHEVGAKIVLVDCLADTYAMNVDEAASKISSRTKAIIPVHLYGNPVEMRKVVKLAKKHDLMVIEDCAQAHMATFENQAVGTFGSGATFSFYPGKNLGAYGDAGLVLCKDSSLRDAVSQHVNHGRLGKYEHAFFAGNFRMDGLQGAVLNTKLKYIGEWTKKRINNAQIYDRLLKKNGFKVIEVTSGAKCVYHIYLVEVSNRAQVMEDLKDKDVESLIHYPVPMHLQPALQDMKFKVGEFPVAERATSRIMSLPMFPELTEEQINYVVKNFLEV